MACHIAAYDILLKLFCTVLRYTEQSDLQRPLLYYTHSLPRIIRRLYKRQRMYCKYMSTGYTLETIF